MMKRRLPPLNALRAFEAAGRLGRMTAAASELSVTPGAISRQVRQLEEALGTALFEGSKQQPALSEAGRRLLPTVSAAFDQIESAVRAVSDEPGGTLDVSCFGTLAMRWLIPRLYDFNAACPDIDVRISATDRDVDIERERYDVVISVDDAQHAEPSAASVLFPEWLGPVLSPELATSIDWKSPAKLPGKLLLHTRTRPDAWSLWAHHAGSTAPETKGQVFEHYYFTLQAATAGLGMCVAPWHLVIDDLQSGRLIAPLGFRRSGKRYVLKRRPQRSAKADRFCAWLARQAAEMPHPA
ncbi:LysR substrate-binding domain-containing protein [Trinickia sp.]|uniref:LysR substrate-binding domain-containing protein n=1 Tax=Trinickia sp. TaxID=2571163 RepID=UPI003F7FE1DE